MFGDCYTGKNSFERKPFLVKGIDCYIFRKSRNIEILPKKI